MANNDMFKNFQEAQIFNEDVSARSRRELETQLFNEQVAKFTVKVVQAANQISDDELPVIQRYASEKDKLHFKRVLVAQRLALESNE
jgi:hypothetical protein